MTTQSSKTHSWMPAIAVVSSLAIALTACGGAGSTAPAAAGTKATEVKSTFDQKLHDSLPESVKQAKKLRIGSPTNNAPFITKPSGDAVGLIPDLAHEVGEVLGIETEFIETPFPGLIPAMQAKRLDIAWTNMNDTPTREQTLNFVNFLHTSAAFMIAKGNPKNINSIEDLCGAKAGTVRGSGQATLMEDQSGKCTQSGKPAVDIKLYDDLATGQAQLASKQIDAFFGEKGSMVYIASKVDNGKAFEVVGKTYLGGVFGIAVPKDEPELADTLMAALKAVEANGAYTETLKKYNLSEDALTATEIQINGVGAGAFK